MEEEEQQELKFLTLQEIASLPIYPEPPTESTDNDGSCGSEDYTRVGYVYFITESGSTDYFKVGRTANPGVRITNLQTGNPRRLDMAVRTVSDMEETERRLLEAMRESFGRVEGGTEWFSGNVVQAKSTFNRIIKNHP